MLVGKNPTKHKPNQTSTLLLWTFPNSSWSASNASVMSWPSWRKSYQINPSNITDCRNIYKQLQQLLLFATALITNQIKHSRADEVCLFLRLTGPKKEKKGVRV